MEQLNNIKKENEDRLTKLCVKLFTNKFIPYV